MQGQLQGQRSGSILCRESWVGISALSVHTQDLPKSFTSPHSLMASIRGNDKILLCFCFSRLDGSLSSSFAFHQAKCLFNSLAYVEADINVLLFRNSLFIIVINTMSIIQAKIRFFIRILYRKLKMISHGCWKKIPLYYPSLS